MILLNKLDCPDPVMRMMPASGVKVGLGDALPRRIESILHCIASPYALFIIVLLHTRAVNSSSGGDTEQITLIKGT